MSSGIEPEESERSPAARAEDLIGLLSSKVVGQSRAMHHIVPYVQMYQAGLAPEGRPVGIFLLMGPTGTGKTRTVEALAEVLHGSAKNLLKVDCGEFQSDHEVAKLVGAPPGYLGHKESQPRLTQQRLGAVASPGCDLSLILFDEIEKAAPSVVVLLLGILDKATLQLGDGAVVNFEKSLIFLTSNLGAREMTAEINPGLGFQAAAPRDRGEQASRLESIGLAAVRKRFSPEFVNRIDVVMTYQPLDAASLATILDQHIEELQQHVNTRLGGRSFEIDVSAAARQFMRDVGTSEEYGAREIKRTIHRHLTQPLAAMVAARQIDPGALVRVDVSPAGNALSIEPVPASAVVSRGKPLVLLVDDNHDFLEWLGDVVLRAGYQVVRAESIAEAQRATACMEPAILVLDYILPDGDGVAFGVEIARAAPATRAIIMSGMELSADDEAICQRYAFPQLRKPFLAEDVLNLVRSCVPRGAVRSASA
jgi:ATP-dependent Clp protease ATP-binding subunit ClpA/ActR/RegA family two-component response regulator